VRKRRPYGPAAVHPLDSVPSIGREDHVWVFPVWLAWLLLSIPASFGFMGGIFALYFRVGWRRSYSEVGWRVRLWLFKRTKR
jgi:hypothetical protein